MKQLLYSGAQVKIVKEKMLLWAAHFENCAFLDHNEYADYPHQEKEGLLACGSTDTFTLDHNDQKNLQHFQDWLDSNIDWAFGILSYDLKNKFEALSTSNPDFTEVPLLSFFRPQYLFEFSRDSIYVLKTSEDLEFLRNQINNYSKPPKETARFRGFRSRMSKAAYLDKIKLVKEHIQLGDIYEMNYCQEYFAENCKIDPLHVFQKLNKISKAPFTAFYKYKTFNLLCASPERFLQRKGNQLISQPIKGTRPRSEELLADQAFIHDLRSHQKDRSEHIMIVDLVRNDIGRCALPGTVQVEELMGLYSFPQVHQLISTISGTVPQGIKFTEILNSTYPMGSMTGAPKISAMQLIDQYEKSARGWYSGSVGYITPEGDFDFNVIIRSLVYNQTKEYLSYQVGGAIVAGSNPEEEYEECGVKGAAMEKALVTQLFPLKAQTF